MTPLVEMLGLAVIGVFIVVAWIAYSVGLRDGQRRRAPTMRQMKEFVEGISMGRHQQHREDVCAVAQGHQPVCGCRLCVR